MLGLSAALACAYQLAPPLAEVASTSVLVSSSCSSFTFTPTWAPAERACKTQGRKARPR